jgi:predicted dehydrogenase
MGGYLDYAKGDGEYRVAVRSWATVLTVRGQYFERTPSIWVLTNYLRHIGLAAVLRKVLSRHRERARNEKFVAVGAGNIIDGPRRRARHRRHDMVLFLAPNHPACAERVVLPEAFLVHASEERLRELGVVPEDSGVIRHLHAIEPNDSGDWIAQAAGWSGYSGIDAYTVVPADLDERLESFIVRLPWGRGRLLRAQRSPVQTSQEIPHKQASRKPSAILLGYGNYAKTVALPTLSRHLDVVKVHEVDPVQARSGDTARVAWSTEPLPLEKETADAYIVAGYHHLHAPIATWTLERGSAAIVEKPLAVDEEQQGRLMDAIRGGHGRYFGCFQRRYTSFNELVRMDLGLASGQPVSYHCIAYEVPLPDRHWYRWPTSHSRLISNGCHWIDHFVSLNGYSEPRRHEVFSANDGIVNVTVELANGAVFTMTLTDQGSERLGVREHVELRANGVTVSINDGTRYIAEDRRRVRRRTGVGALEAYRQMYKNIGERVASGAPGDSPEAVEVSTALTIALEGQMRSFQSGEGSGHRWRAREGA